MHLNCLWIELEFIFHPMNLFLSSDFCVGWGTELVLRWQIPPRHFWSLEILLVYTQKSVSSRTMYIWKTGGRKRLSLKLCDTRMEMYLNPFMWLLMKVLGHMVWFCIYNFFSEDLGTPSLSSLLSIWIMALSEGPLQTFDYFILLFISLAYRISSSHYKKFS